MSKEQNSENVGTIEDLLTMGPIKEPSLFTYIFKPKEAKNIKDECESYVTKVTEFIKGNFEDIEIRYNHERTGFNILMNFNRRECDVISIDWNEFIPLSPPKSHIANENIFYSKQTKLREFLLELGYSNGTRVSAW